MDWMRAGLQLGGWVVHPHTNLMWVWRTSMLLVSTDKWMRCKSAEPDSLFSDSSSSDAEEEKKLKLQLVNIGGTFRHWRQRPPG